MLVLDQWYQRRSSLSSYHKMQTPPSTTASLHLQGCDIYKSKSHYNLIDITLPIIAPPSCNLPDAKFQLFGKFARDNEEEIVNIIRSGKARMCCDGSVKNRKGSFAYGLATSGTNQLPFSQHAPAHGDDDQMTSTSCELMGLLACVSYLSYLAKKYTFERSHFILIIANNEPAIKATTKNFNSIKHTFASDIDIILHLQHKIRSLPSKVQAHHWSSGSQNII